MCGNRRGDLRQKQGWRILNDPLWSAVPISARIVSKQASVEEKMESEASFLVNQTRSCCVRNPDVQAAEGADSWGRSTGEPDNGASGGHSRAPGCQRSCLAQGPDSQPGGGGSGVGLSLSQLVYNLPWFSVWLLSSAYKLNKQGDNIQPWCTPFPMWNQSVVPWPVLTVASWPAYGFLKRQVRWSGIPISFRIFHSLLWCNCSYFWA